MEPEQSDQGNWFDPETIARYVNEEHAETMRDLAEVTPQEQAYAEATHELRRIISLTSRESLEEEIREIEEFRNDDHC